MKLKPILFIICYVISLIVFLADTLFEFIYPHDLPQNIFVWLAAGWLCFSLCFIGSAAIIFLFNKKGFNPEIAWTVWVIIICVVTFVLVVLNAKFHWKYIYVNSALIGSLGVGIAYLISQKTSRKTKVNKTDE